MNKLYDIIKLVMTSTLSNSDIAAAQNVSKNTVRRYRVIATERGYQWTQLAELDPLALEAAFNKNPRRLIQKRLPDFVWIHQELQDKSITLLLLWEEYRSAGPDDALSYSQFTFHYRKFLRTINLTMRQSHRPGERVFVDFSGKRPSYTDPKTGKQIPVELFLGATGYAHYIYALALPSQSLPDWILAHAAMFEHFGGVPESIVPDNLKSAVSRSGRDPVINRTYEDMAHHYGTVILPARPRRPQDKAKVEVAVQVAQRWILARLRHYSFFSLAELNNAVAELLDELNKRPFKRLPGCRLERFEQMGKAKLKPLPAQRYEFTEWTAPQRVGPDYHLLVQQHWYSVPHHFVGQSIEARITSTAVELFHFHQRIACHVRSFERSGHTTDPAHMPEAHRAHANKTPESYLV